MRKIILGLGCLVWCSNSIPMGEIPNAQSPIHAAPHYQEVKDQISADDFRQALEKSPMETSVLNNLAQAFNPYLPAEKPLPFMELAYWKRFYIETTGHLPQFFYKLYQKMPFPKESFELHECIDLVNEAFLKNMLVKEYRTQAPQLRVLFSRLHDASPIQTSILKMAYEKFEPQVDEDQFRLSLYEWNGFTKRLDILFPNDQILRLKSEIIQEELRLPTHSVEIFKYMHRFRRSGVQFDFYHEILAQPSLSEFQLLLLAREFSHSEPILLALESFRKSGKVTEQKPDVQELGRKKERLLRLIRTRDSARKPSWLEQFQDEKSTEEPEVKGVIDPTLSRTESIPPAHLPQRVIAVHV